MADIELVIKIDESKLWLLKNEPIKENFNIYELASYIDKGVSLPKEHGRLIDINELITKLETWDCKANGIPNYAWKCIKDVPTIIEADKAESRNKYGQAKICT